MKVGIIGDTHFGAAYNLGRVDPATQLNSRLLDFSKTFNHIIDEFIKRDVELVILTGDIFETRHPTSAQLNAFSKCIRRAVEKGLKINIVVGNHDQQRNINTTTVDIFNSLKLDSIKVYPDISAYSVKGLHLVLMPYRDRRMMDTKTNAEAIEILRGQVKEQLKDISDPNAMKMLVGHLMLDKTDGQDNPDGFSINELILPHDMFKDFDLVVMGHVHRHSIISKSEPAIIYSGSMEKVSFGEKDHKKVSIVVDTETETVDIIKTPVRDLWEMAFDYSGEKLFKQSITDKIIKDIEEFHKTTNITDAIVKVVVQVNENDMYHVSQERIKEYILSKKPSCLYGIQVAATRSRQLRNSKITETISGKEAMSEFINGLLEPDSVKKKLHKVAEEIINDVEGK